MTPAAVWHLALAAGLYGLHWLEWAFREGRPGWPARWLALPAPLRGLAYGVAILRAGAESLDGAPQALDLTHVSLLEQGREPGRQRVRGDRHQQGGGQHRGRLPDRASMLSLAFVV